MTSASKKDDFRPDCRITLVIAERGTPAKRGLGCELVDSSGRAGFKYRKFLGKGDYTEALEKALLEALTLAARLHKEKPELLLDLPGEKLLKDGPPELKLKVSEFRSFRTRVGSPEEMATARALSEKAFSRD